ILCCVEEFVDVVRIEATLKADLRRVRDARKRHRGAVGKGPLAVRDELARIVLIHASRQRCPGVVSADGLVGGGLGDHLRTRGGAENVFGPYPTPDLTTVSVLSNRQSDLKTRCYVAFPPAIDERVSL